MVSIIGAGPSGNYLAYLLAKAGKDVDVYEEHSIVGRPVQCTGLTTSSLNKLVKIKKEFLVNKINLTRIYSPNGNFIDIKIKDNYVLDRAKFDTYLANRAIDLGANYHFNSRFISCKLGREILFTVKQAGNNIEEKTDYLVGADGPLSPVGKSAGLLKKRKYIVALQARVSMEYDPDIFSAWFGYGDFGWIVPETDNVARVGIVDSKNQNPNEHFKKFLNRVANGKKIIEYQSGLVPVYDRKLVTSKENVFLVGDAAGHVKKTTHGGIILGILAAKELSKVIINGHGNYDRMWKKKIGLDLYQSNLIYNIMSRFSERDYNNLIKDFNDDKIRKILYEYERDFPTKMGFKLLLAKPTLLKYAFKLL